MSANAKGVVRLCEYFEDAQCEERPFILSLLRNTGSNRVESLLLTEMRQLNAGRNPTYLFELIEAVKDRQTPELQAEVRRYLKRLDAGSLGPYTHLLHGGDAADWT